MTVQQQDHTRREQLGAFLRRKREGLSPELIGMARSTRARTPGLRREDVADLAGISAVWYSKIERGKAGGISRELLLTLVEVLRLDETERRYVLALAGMDATPVRDPCMRVSADSRRILDQLGPLPAVLINDYFDIVRANAAFDAMCGLRLAELPDTERNVIALLLGEPDWRRLWQVEDEAALAAKLGQVVAVLRSYSATRPRDAALASRIERFTALSPLFADCWASGGVARAEESLFSFTHAVLGQITLKKQIWLNSNGETSGRLDVYHPRSDEDFARLAGVLG